MGETCDPRSRDPRSGAGEPDIIACSRGSYDRGFDCGAVNQLDVLSRALRRSLHRRLAEPKDLVDPLPIGDGLDREGVAWGSGWTDLSAGRRTASGPRASRS